MAWYKSGSVNVTNGNATVYGVGTLWVDVSILSSGDVWVGPDGRLYEIASFQSNTQLTLASTYLGATANTQAYAIMPIGLLPSALAQQVKTTLSTANTALSQAVRFDANQNLTSGQKATARSNIGATAAADVGLGLLSKSVAGGVDVTLSTDEAANLFYEFTGALTADINVIVPVNVRQFFVRNSTSGAFTLTVKTEGGSGVIVLQGTRALLECDGTSVVVPTSLQAALSVDSSNKLGVNTTSPAYALDVNGIAVGIGTKMASSGAGGNLRLRDDTGAIRWLAGILGGAGATSFDLYDVVAGASRLTIDNAGNMGVGTTSPDPGGIHLYRADTPYIKVQNASGFINIGVDAAGTFVNVNESMRFLVNSGVTEAARLDINGNLLAGTSSGSMHTLSKGSTVDAGVLNVDNASVFYVGDGASYSLAHSVQKVLSRTETGRSIDAAGTINANGTDYAEYMTKADDCGEIAKGQIVGVDVEGRLTDKWADSVSFLVKSTHPSYVGGDVWGTEAALGMQRPIEPVFEPPAYTGSEKPADLAEGAASWGERDVELAQYEADQIAYANAMQAARSNFDTVTMPAYRVALADFEGKLEAERQKVDRIAYCGQVPVNVQGAKPGQYVVPVQDGDGITGKLVDDDVITFEQYRRAVGVVQNILADGRANIRVKVV